MSRHLISHLIRSSCVTRNACRLLLRCLPPTVLWYVPVVLYSVHTMNSPTCSKYIPTCNYKVFRSSTRLTSALFQCLFSNSPYLFISPALYTNSASRPTPHVRRRLPSCISSSSFSSSLHSTDEVGIHLATSSFTAS